MTQGLGFRECGGSILTWILTGVAGRGLCIACNTLRMLVLFYYAPVSKDRGHIVFGLSVCLSAKNFNIGYIFLMVSVKAFIFHAL